MKGLVGFALGVASAIGVSVMAMMTIACDEAIKENKELKAQLESINSEE
jgi:hypothetical protein